MAVSQLPEAGEGEGGGIVAEINVTPLTDIFLVLLIIFMVTTTAVHEEGKNIDLPSAEVAEAAIEAGAEDVIETDDILEVVTSASDFDAVKEVLESGEYISIESSISLIPSTTVALAGADAERMLRLSDSLEDLDDVQNFYANFDISEKEMAEFA